MKTNILSIIMITLLAGTISISCGENSKKDAEEVTNDAKELNKDLKQGAKDTSEEIKVAVETNWQQFKTSSETSIENTEKEIKELRVKISKANKKEQEKLTASLEF